MNETKPRKLVYVTLFLLLLIMSCLSFVRFTSFEAKASSNRPVHNLNTGLNYTTIQDAIDANETSDGQTILVDAGEYNKAITIDKSITLEGESRNNTIIDPTLNTSSVNAESLAVMNITTSNVTIANFNLTGGFFVQIAVTSCLNVTVRDNTIFSTGTCIALYYSSKCLIEGNTVFGFGLEGNDLITLTACNQSTIENNIIEDAMYDGITLHGSDYNLIRNNQISQTQFGIDFYLGDAFNGNHENTIYHNNFEGNYRQLAGGWDGNYFNTSSEGNYWDDYKGKDANQDGIGDTPYVVGATAVDYYPLMGTFQSFNVSNYSGPSVKFDEVDIISNATIGRLDTLFADDVNSPTGMDWFLTLAGIVGQNDTIGFCRITFPNDLMNYPTYHVATWEQIEYGANVTMDGANCTILNSNSENTTLYFTFNLSDLSRTLDYPDFNLIILPEFPSFLILSLFMMAMLMVVVFYKKKVMPYKRL
jgi:nitrous oxidase accessory protein